MKMIVTCDTCKTPSEVLKISYGRNLKRNDGLFICRSCCCKQNLRPQNKKDYWTDPAIKAKHSKAIKASEAYYDALPKRRLKGEQNGMFGKKHTKETKEKMSLSRTGKFGINATGWKGGKMSLTKRVKGVIHRTHDWYRRVYKRDKWKCQKCGDAATLDAHHIKPIVVIIKELVSNQKFMSEEEKFNWLILQPEIIDKNLKNGITLCRDCHKKEHKTWGSHICP